MNMLVFHGERSVSDISKRVFSRLTPRQKEKVEAALIEANPHLKNLGQVPEGAVLHVPELPELSHKRKPDPDRPDAQINSELVHTLTAFNTAYGKRITQEKKNVTPQRALLKSVKFKRATGRNRHSAALAVKTAKALEARSKTITAKQKSMKTAINKLLEDLESG